MKLPDFMILAGLVLTIITSGCKNSSVRGNRFCIETFPVSVAYETGQGQVHKTEEHLFKLDSAFGGVWILESNELERVAVEGIDYKDAESAIRTQKFRDQLASTILPEVHFRGGSNTLECVISVLQEMAYKQDPSLKKEGMGLIQIKLPQKYDPFEYGETEMVSALSAREISLLDVVHLVADVTARELVVEDDHLVIVPVYGLDAEVVTQKYRTDPSLANILKGSSIIKFYLTLDLNSMTGLRLSSIQKRNYSL